ISLNQRATSASREGFGCGERISTPVPGEVQAARPWQDCLPAKGERAAPARRPVSCVLPPARVWPGWLRPIDRPAADPGLLRVGRSWLAPVVLPAFNLMLRMSDPRER